VHGAEWAPDGLVPALRFNGSDSYVECPGIAGLGGVKALTIEMWVYRPKGGGATQYLLYESFDKLGVADPNGTGEYLLVSDFPGKWTNIVRSKKAAPVNRWTHLAFTWDLVTGEASVYYDGVKTGSATGKSGRAAGGDYLCLGIIKSGGGKRVTFSHPFRGMMGDVRIYDKVLPPKAIREHVEKVRMRVGEKGLVLQYDFDEGSGKAAHDGSGHANDGSIHGAVWAKGKRGSALKFDGADDYVVSRYGTSSTTIKALTIEAWIFRVQPGRHQYILYEKHDRYAIYDKYGAGQYCLMSNLPGKWSAVVESKESAPMNQWTHVAFTWDLVKGEAAVYYNGVRRGSRRDVSGKGLGGDYLDLGGIKEPPGKKPAALTFPFRGMLDEVRIYERVLSRREIARRVKGF